MAQHQRVENILYLTKVLKLRLGDQNGNVEQHYALIVARGC